MGGSSFCLWITFSKDGKVRNVIPREQSGKGVVCGKEYAYVDILRK